MHYGFVGLGNLGARLAFNLVEAGFQTTVSDLERGAASQVIARGAKWSHSPEDLAGRVDAVILCLPSPAISTAIVEKILPRMRAGATIIEMSTTRVDEIKRLAELARNHAVDVLECPCTGGIHRAARGEMTVFVGGDEAVLARHSSALDAMCGPRFHIGPVGSASMLKIISNMLCLIDLIAAGEALMLAKCGGLDLRTCYEAICASSGTSREFEDWVPVILNGSFNTGFTLDLALKDLGFATELGKQLDVPLETTTLVKRLFEAARKTYGGEAWTPHVIAMMEARTGELLRADGFTDVVKPVGDRT